MDTLFHLPAKLTAALLEDAKQRDLVTARRAVLLDILWGERFLTREQLIDRVEMRLGKGTFGAKSWDETFFRDMRFVKQAFSQSGNVLRYSRSIKSPGYYLEDTSRLHEELSQAIHGALGELDRRQLAVIRNLSPAQKFFQAVSMIDLGRRVSANIKGQHDQL